MESVSPLMRRFAAAISPAAPIEHGGGADAIARDEVLLRTMVAPSGPVDMLRLWVNQPCLVTTRRLANHPRFEEARRLSAENGWPVHVRASGGTTVVHRPGILNVSLLRRKMGGPLKVADYYAPLTDLLCAAFDAMDVKAFVGSRHGSYCDGAFNVLLGDRKIAGTSCRVIRGEGMIAYLAHAVVWVEGDVLQDIAAIRRFEAALGLAVDYAPGRHVTLEAALGDRRALEMSKHLRPPSQA